MKRIFKLHILTVAVALSTSFTSMASSLPLRFGPKAGVGTAITMANEEFLGKQGDPYTPLVLAFGGGVFLDYKISDLFMVGTSLNYEMGGTKLKFKEETFKKGELARTDHTVIIPITVGIVPIEGLSIQLGPEFQLLLSSKFSGKDAKGKNFSSETTKIFQEDADKQKRPLDIGIHVAVDYDVLDTGFLVGLKYSFGFIGKLQKPKEYEGEFKAQRRTMTPMVTIGYDLAKLF